MKKAIYCKKKKTYTNDCDCEDTARCPAYWKQGIGSLIENGVSNVNNTSTSRTNSTSRS
jgi:hypothetical protein|tara:strand:- start:391 stop:567 length:177 start_codon:yes stop_codon:yes gene_type:complete